MNRQEAQLIDGLFDRLALLEREPRDPEAVRAINDGLQRAPHALYPLVQTVLLQDEALKAANARIEQLEGMPASEPREPRSFLESMRDNLFGRQERHDEERQGDEPRGSVPPVPRSDRAMGAPTGFGRESYGAGPGQPQGYPQQEPGRGGSFLGTAAAAAAGVLGGAMLMNGIRSVMGGGEHGAFQGAFDKLGGGSGSEAGSPWGGGGGSGDLARDAGLGDIGGSRQAGLFGGGQDDHSSLFGGGDITEGDDADLGDFDADFDSGEA
jgi:hypothetical protein